MLDRRTLYAVKHTSKTGEKAQPELQAARREIAFAEALYEIQCLDILKQEREEEITDSHRRLCGIQGHPGFERISRFYGYAETRRSIWLVQGMEGQSLSKLLFEIKGEFSGSERVYRVKHGPVLEAMRKDINVLRLLLRQIMGRLYLIVRNNSPFRVS